MLEGLRKAIARRKHGPKLAAQIERTERALMAMPPDLVNPDWLRWFWSLPPEAWTEAIELKRAMSVFSAEREAAIRAITVRSRMNTVTGNALEAEDAARLGAAAKSEWQQKESELIERKRQFANQYGKVP